MRNPEISRNPENRKISQNLEISRNLEIFEILTIFRISQIFRVSAVWQVGRPRTSQDLDLGGPDGRSDQGSAGPTSDLVRTLIRTLRPAKTWSQALYIDHFQLPPWWKMTGEEGDPFRGPR